MIVLVAGAWFGLVPVLSETNGLACCVLGTDDTIGLLSFSYTAELLLSSALAFCFVLLWIGE